MRLLFGRRVRGKVLNMHWDLAKGKVFKAVMISRLLHGYYLEWFQTFDT